MIQPAPPTDGNPSDIAFDVLCDDFLQATQEDRSVRTYKWYCERLQSFVDHLNVAAPRILAKDIRKFHVLE